jgi:poly(hydroxyalkanoate) granule-associated protein
MATKKKTVRRTAPRKVAAKGGGMLRETWEAARKSLSAAEAEVEKQVRSLIQSSDAADTLRQIGSRLERERRRVARELETRLAGLSARVQKERKTLSKLVDDTVKSALAALNIPSRQEINDLTRKVDELSRKIDGYSARPARRTPARKVKVKAVSASNA